MSARDLAALVAPLDLETFLAEHWEQTPAVLRGAADRAEGLVSLADVVAAMTGEATPQGTFLFDASKLDAAAAPSAAFREALGAPMAPGTDAVWAYVEAGHPIVWNAARGATAALDALTAALAEAFGARVWPNLYATGEQRTPFGMHFDAHEVIVLQIEGRKAWRISESRADRPLDTPGMKPAVDAMRAALAPTALARIALEATVGPGDVVYVPRGQLHEARAVGGRSLHVTFGVAPLSGLDVIEALAEVALADRGFRSYFPPAIADVDGARRSAEERAIATRIASLLASDDVARALDGIRARARR